MSEAPIPEQSVPSEEERLESELQRIVSRRFLRHNRALFDDALQRQALSALEAKTLGLKFVDIYTQETFIGTPGGRALALLATPTGDWLRPGIKTPHFFVYFPVLDSDLSSATDIPTSLVNWIEKVDENDIHSMHTLTEEGIQRSILVPEGVLALPNGPTQNGLLSPRESRELLDELRSFRLAPMDHVPINT